MNNVAVNLSNVSKFYKLYEDPRDRLKEALSPFRKKYHREFYALRDIDLQINKGEIWGIVGENGSGKSTLLKVISGVLTPDTGSVAVEGKISALLELGVGFNPELTGRQNLYFYATVLGMSKDYIEGKIDAILSFADIGIFIDQPIKTYSSGMKARLGFAVATEVDPDILIIDEVLAVGDSSFQRKCYGRVEYMLNQGKTVILVSHNRSSVLSFCEKAILLDKGAIRCEGLTDEVMKFYDVYINRKTQRLNSDEGGHDYKEESPSGNDSSDSIASSNIKNEGGVYDSSLTTEPILFQSADVVFQRFALENEIGQKVNILRPGNDYTVKAEFVFNEDVKNVIFAMRIKTLKGLVISWIGYPFKSGAYFSASAGDTKTITFDFSCNIMDGVYAIDAGLQHSSDEGAKALIGYQDICLVRVDKRTHNAFGLSYMNYRETSENNDDSGNPQCRAS